MNTDQHPELEKENSLTTPADRDVNNKWRPDQNSPPLDQEQTGNAMKELNVTSFTDKFPRVDRTYADPPIPLQRIGLVSFVPAKGATPNQDGVFGFAKLRGNYDNPIEADQRAEFLIKNVDSYHKIYHAYVGRPFPITFSSKYSAEVSEVDIRKNITENISANIKQIKQDEEKEIRDMKEREENLLAESEKAKRGEKAVDSEPYDEYVTLAVKKAQLTWTYLEHMKKMDEVRGIIIRTRKQLADLDIEHPEFRQNYFKKYQDARKKSGLDDKVRNDQDNFIKYMVEDTKLPGIDDLPQDQSVLTPPVPPIGFSTPLVHPADSDKPPVRVTVTTTTSKNTGKKSKNKNKKK